MGDYDAAEFIKNVFIGNWLLSRFLFLLNNIEPVFKIRKGKVYDFITY